MNRKGFKILRSKSAKAQRGFTLLEILLYVSLISIMLLVFSLFLSLLFESRIKNQAIFEVESQGTQVVSQISQIIRSADGINSPAIGTTASSASIDVYAAASDPTLLDLSSGKIRIKEGAGSYIDLNNSKVTASALTFKNLSRSGTPGIMTFQFTLTFVNSSGRNEYDYAKTYYGSASLR